MKERINTIMKTTDTLFEQVETLWEKASEKEFLIKMADGTMDGDRYKWYTVYFYSISSQLKAVIDRFHNPIRDSFHIKKYRRFRLVSCCRKERVGQIR